APAGEAAAEALRAGDAQALPEAVDDDAATFEHRDAGVLEDLGDLVLGVRVVVVVTEYRDHGYGQPAELRRHAARLVTGAVPGQVTGEQQHVGLVPDGLECRAEPAQHVPVEVDVTDRGDPHTARRAAGDVVSHSSSTSSGSCTRVTPMSQCTVRSGNFSATTRSITALRSWLSTSPDRASPPSSRWITRMPSSATRSSSASTRCTWLSVYVSTFIPTPPLVLGAVRSSSSPRPAISHSTGPGSP